MGNQHPEKKPFLVCARGYINQKKSNSSSLLKSQKPTIFRFESGFGNFQPRAIYILSVFGVEPAAIRYWTGFFSG